MKKLVAIFFLFTCSLSRAQVNFVRNPSLEQYLECSTHPDQIKFSSFWMGLDSAWDPHDLAHAPTGAPEYCNVCAGYYSVVCGVPSSGTYFHYPHTGNAMSQVQMFHNGISLYDRDYLQGHLYTTLTSGQSYCVTFYTIQEHGSLFNVNNIGALFDDGTIDSTHYPGHVQNQYTPQVLHISLITDTLNWTKVVGSFIATGNEKYITIGNFTDMAHTTYVLTPWHTTVFDGYSWYLVDDISVIKSDAVPHAGPDRTITTGGDSVLIGDTADSYLPVIWYANGVRIDSNKGGFKVKPDTTTTYVVELQRCDGDASYDTVVVWVGALGNVQINQCANVQISPNPAHDELIVEHASGATIFIYDMIGKQILQSFVSSDHQRVNVSALGSGVYVVQVVGDDGSKKCVRLVKE